MIAPRVQPVDAVRAVVYRVETPEEIPLVLDAVDPVAAGLRYHSGECHLQRHRQRRGPQRKPVALRERGHERHHRHQDADFQPLAQRVAGDEVVRDIRGDVTLAGGPVLTVRVDALAERDGGDGHQGRQSDHAAGVLPGFPQVMRCCKAERHRYRKEEPAEKSGWVAVGKRRHRRGSSGCPAALSPDVCSDALKVRTSRSPCHSSKQTSARTRQRAFDLE